MSVTWVYALGLNPMEAKMILLKYVRRIKKDRLEKFYKPLLEKFNKRLILFDDETLIVIGELPLRFISEILTLNRVKEAFIITPKGPQAFFKDNNYKIVKPTYDIREIASSVPIPNKYVETVQITLKKIDRIPTPRQLTSIINKTLADTLGIKKPFEQITLKQVKIKRDGKHWNVSLLLKPKDNLERVYFIIAKKILEETGYMKDSDWELNIIGSKNN